MVNLLIADAVGLGKTFEGGFVTQELILRYRARSILIVCPSFIQVQWKEEMRTALPYLLQKLTNLTRQRPFVVADIQALPTRSRWTRSVDGRIQLYQDK